MGSRVRVRVGGRGSKVQVGSRGRGCVVGGH